MARLRLDGGGTDGADGSWSGGRCVGRPWATATRKRGSERRRRGPNDGGESVAWTGSPPPGEPGARTMDLWFRGFRAAWGTPPDGFVGRPANVRGRGISPFVGLYCEVTPSREKLAGSRRGRGKRACEGGGRIKGKSAYKTPEPSGPNLRRRRIASGRAKPPDRSPASSVWEPGRSPSPACSRRCGGFGHGRAPGRADVSLTEGTGWPGIYALPRLVAGGRFGVDRSRISGGGPPLRLRRAPAVAPGAGPRRVSHRGPRPGPWSATSSTTARGCTTVRLPPMFEALSSAVRRAVARGDRLAVAGSEKIGSATVLSVGERDCGHRSRPAREAGHDRPALE